MRKIFIGLVLIMAFFLAGVYLFIPGKINVGDTISVNAAIPAVSRILANDNYWTKWWPGKNVFAYHGEHYKPGGNAFTVIEMDIYSGMDTIDSRIELVFSDGDSTTIIWNAVKFTSNNPFKRYSDYRDAQNTRRNIDTLLGRIKSFIEKPENVYGFPIQKTIVVDSVLISTRRSFDHEPGEKDIDAMIQSLKKYIAENNGVETNYPMLNVMKIDSAYYEVMTAIPVDRTLPNTNLFAAKFLLKGGNILESHVRGGPHAIKTAIDQLEIYRSDHQLTSPAIPFQLLVTDRAKEADTTRWITKLYYPIL